MSRAIEACAPRSPTVTPTVSSPPLRVVNPVASASSPRYVEMNRAFGAQSDGGRNMEVAMAATVFRDLQSAGHIPAGARLADTPPASGAGLRGTSYEARLVELIRDRDGNGRLDLDVEGLRSSGLLTGWPTAAQVEGAISGAPRARLSDDFIRNQARNSGLNDYGAVNARGRSVQSYSSGMVLTTAQDRSSQAFVDDVGRRAAQSPEESRRVASEALAGAQALNGRGDQRHAQELLAGTGDQLQAAGRLDDAARVYRELRNAPYASTPVNLVQGRIDSVRRASPDFNPQSGVISVTNGGTTTEIVPRNYQSTYGELAERRLGQIDQTREMQRVTGRADLDPRNMDHARDYFQHYAQGRGTEEVRGEYQRYLQNFYNHAGQGVTWDPAIRPNDRPGRMTDMLRDQPRDGAGRTIVDCEGYTYMNQAILGGVRRDDGSPRFDIVQAGRASHVTSGVLDRGTGQGFAVNNDQATMLTGNLVRNDRWDMEVAGQGIARNIGGNYYDVIGIGRTPEEASPTEPQRNPAENGAPRVGTFVYNGERIIGRVDQRMHDDFLRSQETLGPPSISEYLGQLDRGQRTLP